MKIIFQGEYKSLKDFESEELSDFAVITGKNGSGKTQLIDCLSFESGSVNPPTNRNYTLKFVPEIKFFRTNDLKYGMARMATVNNIDQRLEEYYSRHLRHQPRLKSFYETLFEKKVHLNEFLTWNEDKIKE